MPESHLLLCLKVGKGQAVHCHHQLPTDLYRLEDFLTQWHIIRGSLANLLEKEV